MPARGDIDYSGMLELDLASIVPSVAGPRRPQDRIALPDLRTRFAELLTKPMAEDGYGKPADSMSRRYHTAFVAERDQPAAHPPAARASDRRPLPRHVVEMMEAPQAAAQAEAPAGAAMAGLSDSVADLGHGDVLIAAITSCTNTSNPSVMLAAGLLAKKAVEL